MARGERERLHAALDGNLAHKDAIDRLEVAADEALEVVQEAARDFLGTTPTTLPGTLAMLDHLPNVELFDGDLSTASASIGKALRNLTGEAVHVG